jgi:hypothetical protein
MSLLDLLRQEYVKGKVIDKYILRNGNIGLVVENGTAHKRYHVEFKDNYRGPSLDNLFGLLKEPFSSKTEQLGKLIQEADFVDLAVSYSKGPLRQAYYIHSVSSAPAYGRSNRVVNLPYKSAQGSRY